MLAQNRNIINNPQTLDNMINEIKIQTHSIKHKTSKSKKIQKNQKNLKNQKNQKNEKQSTYEEKTISFGTWNAQGLKYKSDDLIKYMESNQIDFIVVTETWFGANQTLPRHVRKFSSVDSRPNSGRHRNGNGVSIVFNPFKQDTMSQCQIIGKDQDGCHIIFKISNITFIGLYIPPSETKNIDIHLTEIFNNYRLNIENEMIILGDFNCRNIEWNDKITNIGGKILFEWIKDQGFSRCKGTGLMTTSTGPNGGNSVVDHIFTNIESRETRTVDLKLSDHRLVLSKVTVANLTLQASTGPKGCNRIKFESLREENTRNQFKEEGEWLCIQLCEFIQSIPTSGITQTNIDHIDNYITKRLLEFSKAKLGSKQMNHHYNFEYLESETLSKLKEAFKFHKSPILEKEIRIEMDRLKKIKFDKFCRDVDESKCGEMLKIISRMNKSNNKTKSAINNSAESLRHYRQHFQKMTTNSLPTISRNDDIEAMRQDPDPSLHNDYVLFHPSKVNTILLKLAWNKTPGNSGISADIFKAIGPFAAELLSKIFKLYFNTGFIPTSWKRSCIVPVPKKGDLSKIENYRPISLLETTRKIFEHCLLDQLKQTTKISKYQAGFQAGHCCNDQISTLNDILKTSKKKIVTFLDIKAAYDSVDRSILWDKCEEKGINGIFLNTIKNLFDHNSGQILVEGKKSEPFFLSSGVLQGSVLSPILYSIFIDDLVSRLEKFPKLKVGAAKINILLYADDIALVSADVGTMEQLLAECEQHAILNRYRFNVAKCIILSDTAAKLRMHNEEIPMGTSFSYLGVYMDTNGINPKQFVENRIQTASQTARFFLNLGANFGGFSMDTNVRIYQSFIRSKIESGLCILQHRTYLAKRLDSFQQFVMSKMFGVDINTNRNILKTLLGLPTMATRWKWLRTKFVKRFEKLPDRFLIKQSMTSKNSLINKLRKHIFFENMTKEEVLMEETKIINTLTNNATSGYLNVPSNNKPLPFLSNPSVPKYQRRMIALWVLKKFPARKPDRCQNCLQSRATQEHIAECGDILMDIVPSIPPRWRVESALSNGHPTLSIIFNEIKRCVNSCLTGFEI